MIVGHWKFMIVSWWGTRMFGPAFEIFAKPRYTGLVAEDYKRNPNTICTICKKPIYRRPAQLKKNNGNAFCSIICYGISCRKEVPCVACGKMILSGLHKKTCSRACSNRHRSGMKYGHNRPHDKVKYYQALKIRLLERNGKRCQRCVYNKTEILQVHHKDKNRLNNSLENLELICPNCHFEEHYFKKSWLKEVMNWTFIRRVGRVVLWRWSWKPVESQDSHRFESCTLRHVAGS